eukprot:6187207-Pleurochrysis_carterae.AAC.2
MLMLGASRAKSNIQTAQTEGLHATDRLTWSLTAIGTAIWPRSLRHPLSDAAPRWLATPYLAF